MKPIKVGQYLDENVSWGIRIIELNIFNLCASILIIFDPRELLGQETVDMKGFRLAERPVALLKAGKPCDTAREGPRRDVS